MSWKALAFGFALSLVLAGLVWWGAAHRPQPAGRRQDSYGPEVAVTDEHMLHSESLMAGGETFFEGRLENRGNRVLTGLTAHLTFLGTDGRPVQQDTRELLSGQSPPVPPGTVYHFEIGFDHMAPQWNLAPPQVTPVAVYVK